MRAITVSLLLLSLQLRCTLAAEPDLKNQQPTSKLEDFSLSTNNDKSPKTLDFYHPRIDWPGKRLGPSARKLGGSSPPPKPPSDEFPVRLDVEEEEHPARKDSEPLKRNIVSDLKADNYWNYYDYYNYYYPYYYHYYWPYYYYYGLGYRYRYQPYFNKYWSKWSNYYSYPYTSYYDNFYHYWYR